MMFLRTRARTTIRPKLSASGIWPLMGRATLTPVPAALTGARTLLTHSYVEGPTSPPLNTQTLSSYWASEVLSKHSTRPALIARQEKPYAHGGPIKGATSAGGGLNNMGVTTHLAWDYEEFDRHIGALARGLVGLGIEKGDRVAVIMGNTSAYGMLQWACASIGAILVTINPAYRLHELVGTLNLAGVKHLFLVPQIRSSHYLQLLAAAYPDLTHSQPGQIQEAALPDLRNLVIIDNEEDFVKSGMKDKLGFRSGIEWREAMFWNEGGKEGRKVDEIGKGLKNDEVINLQFTSGTTGYPKAVSLSHSNLLNNALSIAKCMHLTEKDVLCTFLATYHLCSTALIGSSLRLTSLATLTRLPPRLVLGNLAAWSQASCIVYPSAGFDPISIVDALIQEQCTALHGVPTHFLGLLEEVDKRRARGEKVDTGRLRTGIAAGSPIPIDLMKMLIEKMGLRDLTNAYGMTETSPVSFQSTPADPIIKRVETVGKVQPHVKAKLIDPDGNIVPVGTPGEILVSGYLVQKGYWNDEKQTEGVMKKDEGGTVWMHTGDEGIMDEEGYLRIASRIKDIIIRGGENLFPVQIENVLTAHPQIREAAVVSVPDAKYGEVVGAWIVREHMNHKHEVQNKGTDVPSEKMTRADVRRCVFEGMNPQNAPAWVWFVGEESDTKIPNELPKTASGKVQKHILREWSKELAKKEIGSI